MFELLPDEMPVYHFTDINAMLNILQEDKPVLRATNIRQLNDTKEILEGKEAILQVLEKDPTEDVNFEHCYVTSFSEIYDSLPMWGMYAQNGCGCVLELNFGLLKKAYTNVAKCHYGQGEILEEVKLREGLTDCGPMTITPEGFIQIPKDICLRNYLADLCLQAKNYSFKYEHEIRGIYKNFQDKAGKRRLKPDYRFCRGEIIDYVNICIDKSALTRVIFGPRVDAAAIDKISEFLKDRRGYHIPYERYDIPYRG